MFRSIFSKYFTVTAVLITVSFLLAAVFQTFFSRSYWIEDNNDRLSEQAENVAGFIRENTLEGPFNTYYISEFLSPMLERISKTLQGGALVADEDFTVILCSEGEGCAHLGTAIPDSLKEQFEKSNTFSTLVRSGILYEEGRYVAGSALYQDDGTLIGYVLVSTSARELSEYIISNLKIYFFSAMAVIMIAFIVLYMITYRLVRPLRQMAAATRRFSQGDFSARVEVKGHDEVAELAKALNNMAVSLSSVEDMRRSFVANVSHELKTPMTTIGGFIDGILDGTVPVTRQKEYLKVVSDEVKRLSRLVSAMLNLSRIDSGQLQFNPVDFDFTELVCSTALSFEQRIEAKHIRIAGLESCAAQTVIGDYDLLQQVVYNLLDNAVKFTEEGGTISLAVSSTGGGIQWRIRNTGDGIPAEELPHIFERFYKSDRSRGLDKTGTGLGLYIVKSVIDRHGGTITASSVPGEYAEFSVWLPVRPVGF